MIEAIRLVNCQSWSDSVIHLASDRINVIQAPNNTGKSVLMKILKISVSPKFFSAKKRKKLIRWDANEARAYYTFSGGNAACVVIQPTKVVYLFNAGDGWVSSLDPPKELIDGLGILINTQGTFIANIIDTDQNLLLVDSDAKSTYEFIHMLCNNASLDLYREKLEENKSWILRHVSDMDLKIADTERKLAVVSHHDIYKMQRVVDISTVAKDMIYWLIDMAFVLKKVLAVMDGSPNFEKLLKLADVLKALEVLRLDSVYVQSFDEELLTVCSVLSDFESLHLQKLPLPSEPLDLEIVDTLDKFETVSSGLLTMYRQVCSAEKTEWLLKDLEKQFLESGSQYECPIYGRVIFDGEKCISDNF